jgi:hypothetical protein
MYLFLCRMKTKMKWFFSTSTNKALYLIILILCRKNLNQSDHMDYKIITIEGGFIFIFG